MKLRLLVCAAPLLLSGCSTLSGMNWGAMNPVNWFSSSVEVSENGRIEGTPNLRMFK